MLQAYAEKSKGGLSLKNIKFIANNAMIVTNTQIIL